MASYQPYGELSINEISSLSIENAKSILIEVNQLIYQHDIAYHQKELLALFLRHTSTVRNGTDHDEQE